MIHAPAGRARSIKSAAARRRNSEILIRLVARPRSWPFSLELRIGVLLAGALRTGVGSFRIFFKIQLRDNKRVRG
jgi:hypothetical protein